MSVAELTKQALDLSESDRAELAHHLLVSLEDSPDEGVEAAWDAEIARRIARVMDGTATSRPAEEVLAELREKLQ
jgi:putative addiction module component (TIGR02574 family)